MKRVVDRIQIDLRSYMGEPVMIGKPMLGMLGTLGWSHVDSKNDAAALIAVQVSGIIA